MRSNLKELVTREVSAKSEAQDRQTKGNKTKYQSIEIVVTQVFGYGIDFFVD